MSGERGGLRFQNSEEEEARTEEHDCKAGNTHGGHLMSHTPSVMSLSTVDVMMPLDLYIAKLVFPAV